jgi:hypothetical protein
VIVGRARRKMKRPAAVPILEACDNVSSHGERS